VQNVFGLPRLVHQPDEWEPITFLNPHFPNASATPRMSLAPSFRNRSSRSIARTNGKVRIRRSLWRQLSSGIRDPRTSCLSDSRSQRCILARPIGKNRQLHRSFAPSSKAPSIRFGVQISDAAKMPRFENVSATLAESQVEFVGCRSGLVSPRPFPGRASDDRSFSILHCRA